MATHVHLTVTITSRTRVKTTLSIILGIYTATALVPLTIYYRTRQYQDPSMRYLAMMLLLSFLVDGFGFLSDFWFPLGKSGNAIVNTYGFFEIWMVIMLYHMQLSPEKKLPFLIITILLVIAQFVELLVFQDYMHFAAVSRAIFAAVVTVLGLLYFFKLIKELPTVRVYNVPMFWINIGMMVYYTGNFFLFVMRNYLVYVLQSNISYHWSVHNILGVITYIFFSIGLWQARPKKEDSGAGSPVLS